MEVSIWDYACEILEGVFEALEDVGVMGKGSIVCILIKIDEFYCKILMFFCIVTNQ